MNRTPALKVLIASNHADIRVAVSWMLRQSFPDAIVSKAETVAEAVQLASAESVTCVISDASLPRFAEELTGLSQSLQRQSVPLIVIHDRQEAPQADVCEGISAWLDRASINVTCLHLAISQVIEHVEMLRIIEGLEQELSVAREQLEANAAVAVSPEPPPPVAEVVVVAEPPSRQVEPSHSSLIEPLPARHLERPGLVTSGLEISSDDERELAARVQRDLMPPGSPLVAGFDIAGLSIHAETTGGDYYDYLPMAEDLLCISIGECSGRGLAPAMYMASLRAYLRVLASQTTDISDIVSRLNSLITEDIGDEDFIVTLMLFQIDDRTRTMRYVSAGQQAFLLDRDGNVDVLHSTGMPLGLRDETVIPEGEPRKIRTGEILLLASDGVQKMTSETGEQFGTDRMLNLVNENRQLPSRIIANYLRKACTEFASPQFQHDDVTIVIVKGDDS
jgi:serine phosphatase RsbU (regulator of sigma subunit)